MSFSSYPAKGGIPSGNTAARPSSPVIGDTYYNGQLEILEIFNGTQWVANSAPPAVPSVVSVTDVGGNIPFATGGTLNVTVAPGTGGATPLQYNIITTTGGYSVSTSGTTGSLTGLIPGSYAVAANAQNNFGTTVNSQPFASVTATTVPQAPTIGTATASTTANEVTVTWTLNSNGGKALSAITITPLLNGTTPGTSRTAATTSSTSYTFTTGQLTPSASYTFRVTTTNANGTSLASNVTNSVSVPNYVSFDYLVVAGGGGAGLDSSGVDRATGGGGAGGLRSTVSATGGGGTLESPVVLNAGSSFTVTVGAGGAQGSNGSASVFSNITSTGGGAGGYTSSGNVQGSTGGSGGGGSAMSGGVGSAGTASQGYAGGGGTNAGPTGAGAGGGAGATGGAGSNGTGGDGGTGVSVSITGTATVYAGGGGGGAGQFPNSGATPGGGGNGGGGAGGTAGNGGTSGTANRGGGAGGQGGGGARGGSGGSGVVVLRYPSNLTLTVGGGLTASTATSAPYKITTFNAGTGSVSF